MNNINAKQNFSDSYVYRKLSSSLYRTTSREGYGWVTEFLYGAFYFLVNIGAFSVRILLRWNMGIRSFGFISIVFLYLWIRVFLIYMYSNDLGCEYFQISEDDICPLDNKIEFYLSIFIDLFAPLHDGFDLLKGDLSIYLYPQNHPDNFGYALHIFSLFTLGLSLLHYSNTFIRDIIKVKSHSFHRGDSVFFGWLKGKKIVSSYEINEHVIWAVLDPLWVIFIAYFFESILGYYALSILLQVGAVCLMIQEFQVWNRNKDMIRNMIDQEIDAELLLIEREKYKAFIAKDNSNDFKGQKGKATVH
jgi:hypothetical protein